MTRLAGQFEPIWIGRATGWARSLRCGAASHPIKVRSTTHPQPRMSAPGQAVSAQSNDRPVFHRQRPYRCTTANWRLGPQPDLLPSKSQGTIALCRPVFRRACGLASARPVRLERNCPTRQRPPCRRGRCCGTPRIETGSGKDGHSSLQAPAARLVSPEDEFSWLMRRQTRHARR
jgi:hypothetical protein